MKHMVVAAAGIALLRLALPSFAVTVTVDH